MQKDKTFITTLPDLIEIQKTSFCWFIKQGLYQEFERISSILDFTNNLEVWVFGNEYKLKMPNFNAVESKTQEITYSAQIYMPIEIRNKEQGTISNKQKILIGLLPLMTESATFIINGCERVLISQIIRSPGIYFTKKKKFNATLIADQGSWLNFDFGSNPGTLISNIMITINTSNKITAIQLLNSMGLNNVKIQQTIQQTDDFLSNSFELDNPKSFVLANSIFSQIFDPLYYNIGRVGRIKLNQKLKLNISENIETLTYEDILGVLDYLIEIDNKKGLADDIDHLQNRRIRSIGELLKNQYRIGFKRMSKLIKEHLTLGDSFKLKPTDIITTRPLIILLREFFGSSQLSQFMDQTNPLSALTHKRRISGLGPGGLDKDRISFAVRDIHPSHYGRICPIETPEGQNAGLISSLTTCAQVNSYGFIETPFWKVKNGKVIKKTTPVYLTADIEDCFNVASADIVIDSTGFLKKQLIPVRCQQEYLNVTSDKVDFIAVSPVQIVSIAAALIPFFEHDDANRALMGSNMQRQSVPLVFPQPPIVGTGLENQVAIDSGLVITAFKNGIITFVSTNYIHVLEDNGENKVYILHKYNKSNQNTEITNKPIVWVGEIVESGQVLADGPGTKSGELALGQNLIVAYMPWQGYNFEDAILINERLVYENIFTSLQIEKHEIQLVNTLNGPEETTKNLPFVPLNSMEHLDENGIVLEGTFVKPGDILVGKITPKNELLSSPESNLLHAILGENVKKNVRNTSLKVPNGEYGRVLKINVITKKNSNNLPKDTLQIINIFLAQIKRIQVGDKIAGRHGNKGIISLILPREDMPYLPDGTPVDIILNPLGVPSRMNVGQLYECLLGLAGSKLNRRFKILPFDEMYGYDASRILINKKLRQASLENNEAWVFNPYSPGKLALIDGRTGDTFENPITVGKAYMLKLIHLVDNKIHARSTGPYSLVTQQPLGGKSRKGGQRFGEMEVWALEAFGAAYILQELLTIKSDDIQGRKLTTNAILNGHLIPKPGIPESFNVLISELRAIGLDIRTYKIERLDSKHDYTTEVYLMEKNDL